MKNHFIFLLIIILLIDKAIAQPQKEEHPLLIKPFFSIGYIHASPGLVRDYNNLILNSYRSKGIPIPTQRPFGRTIEVNGGVYFSLLKYVGVGLSVGYLYSPFYSNYKDYAGTLKVYGSVQSYTISLVGENTITKIGEFPLNLFFEVGESYTTAAIFRILKLNDYQANNSDKKWLVNAWGPFVQATVGTSFQLGKISVSPQCGYRLSLNITASEVTKAIYFEFGDSGESRNIGQSGFIFIISFRINI